jgi:hypothetical protein
MSDVSEYARSSRTPFGWNKLKIHMTADTVANRIGTVRSPVRQTVTIKLGNRTMPHLNLRNTDSNSIKGMVSD